MKKVALLFCLLMAAYTFAQDFTSAAAQEIQLDEFGNYLNNSTDRQGQKQGDWFYLDIQGNQMVKEVYTNNKKVSTHINFEKAWVNIKDFLVTSKYNEEASKMLSNNGIQLNDDRQVMLILNGSGEIIQGNTMGKWTVQEEHNVISLLTDYFKKQHIKSFTNLFILL